MTLFKIAPVGLLSVGVGLALTGCFGTGKTCDTATGVGCDTDEADADTDADSDADSDSDSDADTDVVFDAYVMNVGVVSGYDGAGLVGYVASGNALDPYASVTLYEEAYFDAGDDRYLCEDFFSVVENGVDDLQVSGIWAAWDVSMVYLAPGDAPCDNLDSAIWGDTTPVGVFEATQFGVGVGPMSAEHEATMTDWISGSYDPDDVIPFWLSYYLALYDEDSGALLGSEIGYSWAFVADENMEMVDGNNCLVEGVECVDISTSSELPANSILQTGSYYLLYTSNLF